MKSLILLFLIPIAVSATGCEAGCVSCPGPNGPGGGGVVENLLIPPGTYNVEGLKSFHMKVFKDVQTIQDVHYLGLYVTFNGDQTGVITFNPNDLNLKDQYNGTLYRGRQDIRFEYSLVNYASNNSNKEHLILTFEDKELVIKPGVVVNFHEWYNDTFEFRNNVPIQDFYGNVIATGWWLWGINGDNELIWY